MATSGDIEVYTIEKLDPENMGVAVEILFLCALELKIWLGGNLPPPRSLVTSSEIRSRSKC